MPDHGPIEILLIEDDRTHVELTLHALSKHHQANSIHVVRDGAEALDYLFGAGAHAARNVQASPKLILLEYHLPKVSGAEVLRRIKADARTRSIPVVVLTASEEKRDRVDSYQLGANSCIVKPVDSEQFTSVVEKLDLYWLRINQPPRTKPA